MVGKGIIKIDNIFYLFLYLFSVNSRPPKCSNKSVSYGFKKFSPYIIGILALSGESYRISAEHLTVLDATVFQGLTACLNGSSEPLQGKEQSEKPYPVEFCLVVMGMEEETAL